MPAPPLAKLLIVDDEPALMTALRTTLEEQGFMTAGFTSAKAALASLTDQTFDLVITDLMMPEMDGLTLLRAAQQIDRNLVGIVMTGHGTIDTAVETMQAGALDYILKPFKLSAVLPVLSRALGVRRLRMDNEDLQQRVRDRTTDLEAANLELEAFSYSVSHDLRAPLRHITGYAEMLVKSADPSLNDESRHCLKNITDTADEMQHLIEHLLEFSRLGRVELNCTAVDLEWVVQDAIQGLEPETRGRNVVWKRAPLPTVQGDPFLLKQVFVNLLSNALKYTRPRDPAQIEIACADEPGGDVVVVVRDNGVGFDMEYASKLFGVFQRLHRQDQFEGIGIGLANVQRIMTRHGGRVWAEAVVNEGASFFLSFGREQRREQPAAKSEPTR